MTTLHQFRDKAARYAEFRAKMLRANMGRDSRTNNLFNSYDYLLFCDRQLDPILSKKALKSLSCNFTE